MECVFPLEKALDELTETSFVRGSVEAMSLFDRGTLLLAACFLSLACIGERKVRRRVESRE